MKELNDKVRRALINMDFIKRGTNRYSHIRFSYHIAGWHG